jgi:CheY-like chemotaxis protein
VAQIPISKAPLQPDASPKACRTTRQALGASQKKETGFMALSSEKRILVVDDEPDVREFLKTCIEDAGFMTQTAVDGMDGLEKAKQNPPDLITLDMVMPRKSGIRFMRELREDENTAQIPVIVITAHARDELGSEQIQELNAFTARLKPKFVLEKPITPQKLVESIARILDVTIAPQAHNETTKRPVEEIRNMLAGADPDTLAQVRALLNKR